MGSQVLFRLGELLNWREEALVVKGTPEMAAMALLAWVVALVILTVCFSSYLPLAHMVCFVLCIFLTDSLDASVTQSALEEALASHMNRGAGSRFSISQAFRSRYTPSGNQ
jgi:hypothetical protein